MKITEGTYVNSAGTEVVVAKRCSDMSINYPFHCTLPTGVFTKKQKTGLPARKRS